MTGAQSGYPLGTLTNIAVDYIVAPSSSVNPLSMTVGGDLYGTLPNPSVVGLRGNPIANTAPTSGQFLRWDGSSWAPSSAASPGALAGNGLVASGSTLAVLADGSSLVVSASGVKLATAYQALLDGATSSATASTLAKRDSSGKITLSDGDGSTTYGTSITFSSTATEPTINQTSTTAASTNGRTLRITAQNAGGTGSPQGGSLHLNAGRGFSGGTAGMIRLGTDTTTIISVDPSNGELVFDKAVADPIIYQEGLFANSAPNDLIIRSQAPAEIATGANRKPGDIVLSLPDPTNGGSTPGSVVIAEVDAPAITFSSLSGQQTISFAAEALLRATEGDITIDGSNSVHFKQGGALIGRFDGDGLRMEQPQIYWAYTAGNPFLYQETNPNNGETGSYITIQAQNCSGSASNGGSLVLMAGNGTSTKGAVNITIPGAATESISCSEFVTLVSDPGGSSFFRVSGNDVTISGEIGLEGTALGFFGTSPQAKPTITGSRGSNAALASLLTALANMGLITNSTS
jgi:hypothetical protein